jgi:hypothetical protein
MAKARRKVFISAAAKDAPAARELADRLNAEGVDAWSQELLLPGANVQAEVGRALEQADAVVVLVSPAAMKSPWVRREIQFALGHEKLEGRLIPVLVKQTPSDDIPWILRTLQWVKGGADDVTGHVLKALQMPRRREARSEAR